MLKMRKFADLERYLCRIYKYSISTQSNAVYVEANSLSRLDELFLLLSQMEGIIDVLDEIFGDRSDIVTKRLKALITFQSKEIAEGFGTKGKLPFSHFINFSYSLEETEKEEEKEDQKES